DIVSVTFVGISGTFLITIFLNSRLLNLISRSDPLVFRINFAKLFKYNRCEFLKINFFNPRNETDAKGSKISSVRFIQSINIIVSKFLQLATDFKGNELLN